MLLPNIESAKVGKVDFENAFIILKNGLIGKSKILADNLSGGFLFLFAHKI